jgi:uncharacterized protein (DUF849 family)
MWYPSSRASGNTTWEKQYLGGTDDFIFPNTFKTIREFTRLMDRYDTRPEFEIYDVGMINNLAYLIGEGQIRTAGIPAIRHGHPGGHSGHR